MRILLVFGVLFTIAAGLSIFKKPYVETSSVILKPSHFDRPEEIGAVLFRRFWVENQIADLVVFVSSPFIKTYDQIWNGFISVSRNEGRKFDLGFREPILRPLNFNSAVFEMPVLEKSIKEGRRVWVHMTYSSQKIALMKALFPKSLILIQTILPLTDQEVQLNKSICHSGIVEGDLLCKGPASLTKREVKKIDLTKNVAAVYQVGPGEMLVEVYEPSK